MFHLLILIWSILTLIGISILFPAPDIALKYNKFEAPEKNQNTENN